MADPALRRKLEAGEFFYAPGVFDMMAAHLANRHDFDAVYASGYWLTASALGLPDVGLATYTDMITQISRVCETSRHPVIADADTGYGGLINLRHAIRGYERAGVSGFQFEDQVFPKKCGHTPGRPVIPLDDMVTKIQVAVDSRSDRNMLIIARTDSRSDYGLDEAVERAGRFAEAGADIVFVEALESVDEMRHVISAVDAPLLANMAVGGYTPILPPVELAELGFAAAIYPATSALPAMAAVDATFTALATGKAALDPAFPPFDFREMCDILGFPDIHAFEDRWRAAAGDGTD